MEGEARPLPHHEWWLDVGEAPTSSSFIFSTADVFRVHSAGIAGINKTVAISSITQTSDLTYAIHTLNTWVLTEMWFIIIFGSIPPLRLFFVRFRQNMKPPSSYASNNIARSAHVDPSRGNDDAWVPLGDRAKAWATYDPSTKRVYNSRKAESEEEILPERSHGDQIVVTHETQIKREDIA